ncbi:hypothetical protein C7974DRAFT_458088 [Boeremia exigua]|uniref:uncharacterized protein n=1 Tax=Boeremia exigua TaxID=749465 RepID=UPI001E8E043B|nr:uncharacterized protein C7974DRAFT_458088 [Boeremia exigua]KAH6620136.1 hypothetical protein C7974DRAFT_458088 [Boeremia exigua]
MKPLIIRVEEHGTSAPVLTLRYICRENELDIKTVFAHFYNMIEHPGRAHFDQRLNGNQRHDVIPCSEVFLELFWQAAAYLLDYFADFYATDNALMQSIWFRLLDVWQVSNPAPYYRADGSAHLATAAEEFEKECKDTMDLIHRLMAPKSATQEHHPVAPIIHDPHRRVKGLGGWYETGPFISGLKPWQQFLYSGAPGFTPAAPPLPANTNAPRPRTCATRYLPQPAIALILSYTARARTLTRALAQKHPPSVASSLAAFDAHALALPAAPGREYTLPSVRPGRVLAYQLVQGAPPVKRYEGLTDPSMLVEEPDLVLLDEAVGICKGREAYVPMTGPVGVAGVGFDVWAVSEREDAQGGMQRGVERVLLGEMFDEWDFGEEEEKF